MKATETTRRRSKGVDVAAIERRPGVRGGSPVIAGTGIRVIDVAIRHERMGMSADEIGIALPHLSLAQVYAALSYYFAHKPELDREWRASLRRMDRLRRDRGSVLERKLAASQNLHR